MYYVPLDLLFFCKFKGLVMWICQGTPDHLMQHLVQEHSNVDRTYVEDFLLCFRIFIKDPMELADRLKIWFETPSYRNKV